MLGAGHRDVWSGARRRAGDGSDVRGSREAVVVELVIADPDGDRMDVVGVKAQTGGESTLEVDLSEGDGIVPVALSASECSLIGLD